MLPPFLPSFGLPSVTRGPSLPKARNSQFHFFTYFIIQSILILTNVGGPSNFAICSIVRAHGNVTVLPFVCVWLRIPDYTVLEVGFGAEYIA